MKDKNLAAVLAFFGGAVGLHRFYLGQVGLGILYFFIPPLSLLLGVIDAISFLSMDQSTFDAKYNKEQYNPTQPTRSGRQLTDREKRHQQRQQERARREQMRSDQRATRRSNSVPQRTSRTAPVNTPNGQAERKAGLRYFKDFEYDRAIIAFERALEKNPRDVASHFNIACSYSCEEEADKAFYHLDRAIALGFADFERIRTHDSLAFLRVQPGFQSFEENGYRLAPDLSAEEVVLENPIKDEALVELPEINDDLLEQLQRLATLKEKGLLTEGEFATQKKRLLG
ncbi:NINE protein [Neolewinella aurantiaca]|uniref:NINE protein n=1 Tax=Neolewinella aurantiaca TaxID=2602767 RepID=A0A5C7FY24_9BACT|nr:NINE protein [Neolewinella aurantiaca]TXF89930.1 NINE protein [Neolewinella aurantiaca]